METKSLTEQDIKAYRAHLLKEERSKATIEKYGRDIFAFYQFLKQNTPLEKENVIEFKRELSLKYTAVSVNSMLVAVNGLLKFLGRSDCCVKLLKIQREFCSDERELSRAEYCRLVNAAKRRDERTGLIMQTICSTGIRVSELSFITVESLRFGQARVCCKGKERAVLIPKELKKLLLQYCNRRKIASGSVFVTSGGKPLDRSNIWAAMKRLCQAAGVAAKKVFPHNLRHLFALTFYRLKKDLVHLADILGHSSIETTRIYTATSSGEHRRLLARMDLVVQPTG